MLMGTMLVGAGVLSVVGMDVCGFLVRNDLVGVERYVAALRSVVLI